MLTQLKAGLKKRIVDLVVSICLLLIYFILLNEEWISFDLVPGPAIPEFLAGQISGELGTLTGWQVMGLFSLLPAITALFHLGWGCNLKLKGWAVGVWCASLLHAVYLIAVPRLVSPSFRGIVELDLTAQWTMWMYFVSLTLQAIFILIQDRILPK